MFKWIAARGDVVAGLAIVATILIAGIAYQKRQYQQTPHLTKTAPPLPPNHELPFTFAESAAKVGLIHRHEKFQAHPSLINVAPMLVATAGASVAVVDYDRDGWPDVYLTSGALGSKNALFRNNHDGTFTDMAAQAGIANVNETQASLRAIFFDYDNDGYDDLLLTTTMCPRFFRNRGDGTFEEKTDEIGIDYCGYVTASNVLDYDGDGRLDIVLAGYFQPVDFFHPDRTDFLFPRLSYADGGGPIVVFHNEGNGKFQRVPGNLGIKSRGWTHAVGVYDLHGSGRQDLYFATDFNEDQLYFNEGGRFVNEADRFIGGKYARFGMSAEIADVANDGLPEVYVTDIFEPNHEASRNALWKMTRDGHIQDRAAEAGVVRCGWSWGSKFADFDDDGLLDLALTNSMISADPRKSYWYMAGVQDSGNIMAEAKRWPPIGNSSWSGYQTKCVFHNEAGKFVYVSAQTDMGADESDGRGLAAIDFRNEGLTSLVEASVGQPARFYRNVARHKNHWIGFSLEGTRSNRDGFGTQVSVRLKNGVTQSRELEPANGYETESDERLLFGLGADAEIESIHVRWPLGATQDLNSLAIDRYHLLREP